jgi:cytochrome b6-f complex iron-sulfur subunit
VNRRRFLALTGGLLATPLLGACVSQGDGEPEVSEVVFQAGEIPPAGDPPVRNEPGRFYLINNEDGLLALSSKCTHQGCNVDWEADRGEFHCPCHGSVFDRHGDNTAGPAPRPLDLLRLTAQSDGSILVQTSPVTEREDWDPSQATEI